MKIFLTGKPGMGKTTVCITLVDLLREKGLSCGGVISREIRENGIRTGFEFIDVETGNTFLLASIHSKGPCESFGKYHVSIEGIRKAVEVLKQTKARVVFVDELGPMEMRSGEFMKAVQDLLLIEEKGEKDIVVVVHRSKASGYECIEVTISNRKEMPARLASRF